MNKQTTLWSFILLSLLTACSKSEQKSSDGVLKNEQTTEQVIIIPTSSTSYATRPLVAKVFINSIGDYSVAIGKDQPVQIQQDQLDAYLSSVQAKDSTMTLAIYADEEVNHGKVVYVYDIANQRHMKVVIATKEDETEEVPRKPEQTRSEPTTQPVPVPAPAEKIVSDEELLAIRQQQIADSIADAQQKANEQLNSTFAGITFSADTEEQNTTGTQPPVPGSGKSHKGSGSDGIGKWSLDGRGLVGRLPIPGSAFNQEGTVIVQITVDEAGNVYEVHKIGGTITDDRQTIQMALDAAKRAKFTSSSKSKQIGTITYSFKFN